MKKVMIAAALAASLGSAPAFADGHANNVTLQLQWVTQAQFAGYYVALDKGFYAEEGQDDWRLVLWQRIPVPVVDEPRGHFH